MNDCVNVWIIEYHEVTEQAKETKRDEWKVSEGLNE